MPRVRIIVDNRVRIARGDLTEAAEAAIREAHEHDNPAWHTRRHLGIPTGDEPRTIVTWHATASELSVPRGGMATVRSALRKEGLEPAVRDARHEGAACSGVPEHRVKLREYQERMVDAGVVHETCILRAATGSGKTVCAFALASRLRVNTLVILPTGALYEQWKARAARELGLEGHRLGEVRGKVRRLRPLTIAMQQTLYRSGVDEELRDFFGAIIEDEVQLAAASSVRAVIDPFPARYRIGISASERRKDRKEFLIYGLFGGVAIEVGRDELEEVGHVLPVEIRCIPTSFTAPWYGLKKASAGDEDENDEEKSVNFPRLLGEMTGDPARNALLLGHLEGEVAEGEPIIVLSHRVEHCRLIDREMVARSVRSGLLLGEQENAREFATTSAGLLSGERQVGIGTYQALGFGVDLPAVGVGFATTPIAANPQTFNQVRGRLCRPAQGKRPPRLYYLLDELVYPRHLASIAARDKHVTVWSGGRWVPARQYMTERRKRKTV